MDFNINNYLSNLSYINKDFNSIWEEILEVFPKLTDKFLPAEANESDPLVVLLKELGIVSDKLNYNIDKNTLEQFPDLLTQLRTAYSVFKSMGYNPSWYKSAVTKIAVIYNGGVGDVRSADIQRDDTRTINLPRFTQVSDENNENIYTLLESAEFTPGSAKQVSLIAIEGTINDLEINGDRQIKINNLDSQNRLYFVQPNVAQNGIFIDFDPNFENISLKLTGSDQLKEQETLDDQQGDSRVWKRVDNLYQQLPGSYVYKFGIDPSTGTNYIQFPDDIGTLIDRGIYVKYILSSGDSGNIKAGTITQLYSDPDVPQVTFLRKATEGGAVSGEETGTLTKSNFTVHNAISTQNGSNPETIEEMQKNYERVVGTFNTLVTLRDYNNYIYNATDDISRNLVSNIKVSDRGDDLYDHLTYKTLEVAGTFADKSVVLNNDMTAYDLRLYPLKNTSTGNINTLQDFNQTFDAGEKVDAEGKTKGASTSEDLWVKSIIDSVEETKTINHDFKNSCGVPIFVDYDISGQIYLQKIVSGSEAIEIQQNVNTAIYKAFNSRELHFGEAINYPKLAETVKNADPRIQYAAINPLVYSSPDLEVFNNLSPDYDVTTRSILAGATPWAVLSPGAGAQSGFSPFTFHYNQKGTAFYGAGDEPANLIKSISPQVSVFHKVDGGIETHKNETYSIIVPSYITATTYGNFFYIAVNGVTLKSGVPHKLGDGQAVYIYETRDAKVAKYTLTTGTIVLFSGSEEYPEITSDSMINHINMGSKLSLSVLERDENLLQNSEFLSNPTAATSEYQVKIASNAEGLFTYLCNDDTGDGYTLNIGEYLLFADYNSETDDADSPVLEVGIIGEGNTIYNLRSKALLTGNDESSFLIKTVDITNGDFTNTPFVAVSSGALKYAANSIYNLGEGYKIVGIDTEKTSFNSTQVFSLTLLDDVEITESTKEPPVTLEATNANMQWLSNQWSVTKFKDKTFASLTWNSKNLYPYVNLYIQNPSENNSKINISVLQSSQIIASETIDSGKSATLLVPALNVTLQATKEAADGSQVALGDADSLGITLTATINKTISYYLNSGKGSKGNYIYPSEPTGSILPILEGDSYRMSCQLALILTPNNEQTLEEGQEVVLGRGSEDSVTLKSATLQATSTIIYSGGQPLELTDSESKALRIMSYKGTPEEEAGAWIGIDKIEKLPTITSGPVDAFLFAYLKGGTEVGYVVAAPEATKSDIEGAVDLGKEASLSTKLLGILKGSKYYYCDSNTKSWSWQPISVQEKEDKEYPLLIKGVSAAKELEDAATGIYYTGYSPLYTPSDNVILDPTNPESFFLSNHPCNKYVLPRLRGKDGTDPLQNLEISRLSIRS